MANREQFMTMEQRLAAVERGDDQRLFQATFASYGTGDHPRDKIIRTLSQIFDSIDNAKEWLIARVDEVAVNPYSDEMLTLKYLILHKVMEPCRCDGDPNYVWPIMFNANRENHTLAIDPFKFNICTAYPRSRIEHRREIIELNPRARWILRQFDRVVDEFDFTGAMRVYRAHFTPEAIAARNKQEAQIAMVAAAERQHAAGHAANAPAAADEHRERVENPPEEGEN